MEVANKGQATIPQQVRIRLGLLPHTEVEFEGVDDSIGARIKNFRQE